MFQHTTASPITPSIIPIVPHLLHHTLTSSNAPSPPPSHPHLLHHTLTSSIIPSSPPSHPHLHHTVTPPSPPKPSSLPHLQHPYLIHHTLTSITPSPPPSHPHLLHQTLTSSITPSPLHHTLNLLHHTLTSSTKPLPPDRPPSREEPMESISSMNMIEGACSLAMTKSSLTMRDPSPMYFCTSSEPDTLIKVHSVWCATALAKRVLPVPGGPNRSTP